ncbi:MAG TPA: energy transducer TonB [Candidatus Binatia bacterium]|nr:energy transducer TonB [Candidatus Binatia bacterium]
MPKCNSLHIMSKQDWHETNVTNVQDLWPMVADRQAAHCQITAVTFKAGIGFVRIVGYVDAVNDTWFPRGILTMKSLYILMVTLALSYFLAPAVRAQNLQSSPEGGRRIVLRVAPQYPAAAKRMRLGGVVKVIALVGSDGKVKRVEPVGGSPLLVQAAETAIAQWKYAPGPESEENVELHFTP